MKKKFVFILFFVWELFFAGDISSSFTKINEDKIVEKSPYSIITKKINLKKDFDVLIVADGSFSPYKKNGIAKITIQIDGDDSYSNTSVIDWYSSNNPVTHGFNCIASQRLSKGQHIIKLIAIIDSSTPNSNFIVNKDSGLSILVDPAPNIVTSRLEKESELINYITYPKDGKSPIPMKNILTNEINVGNNLTNVITLSSGSAYDICGQGDALWGIFLNNEECISNSNSLWSVNDLITGAELKAPMFNHSLHQVKGSNIISLKAGELSFNYFENKVCYKVASNTRLISLYGMGISGKAVLSNSYCNRKEWECFGSSGGVSFCNVLGSRKEYASLDVNIPNGHNGVVLFLTKVRLQPGIDACNGSAYLWINIDGKDVGTVGKQTVKAPNCLSSRTLSASYLSSGANKLLPGNHIIKVFLKAEGTFNTIHHSLDLPLVYLD